MSDDIKKNAADELMFYDLCKHCLLSSEKGRKVRGVLEERGSSITTVTSTQCSVIAEWPRLPHAVMKSAYELKLVKLKIQFRKAG